jgi:hypothetical protein
MEDLDGDVRGRDPLGRALQHSLDIPHDILPEVERLTGDIEISGRCKIWLQLGFVDLSNSSHSQRLLIELDKYVIESSAVEGSFNGLPCSMHRMCRGI